MTEGNKNGMFGRITDLDMKPLEYYELVGRFNLLIQSELTKKLTENKEFFGKSVTFITPGSDARLEKGSMASPLEIISLVDADIDLEAYKESLIEVFDKISPTRIAKSVEMKGPHSSLVNYQDGRPQPGRIADGRLIYGSPDTVLNTKVNLGKEIINLHTDEVDRIAGLKRQARKVVERGRNTIAGTDAIHFDLNSGTIFFNPEAYQLSFKVGPLRLVQNTLLIEEVKNTRRENNANFISSLDPNIVSRLNQLSDDRMLNLTKASVQEITEHYAFFLRLYHRSERAYEHDKTVALKLTPGEVAEVGKRLQALSSLMDKFKIQKQAK